MHRSQLPLLLAWSTSPQSVLEPLQNLQALNPLQSLPIYQLVSSFILLLIQLRSHGPSLLNTFFRTLNSSATLSFHSPLWQKAKSEWIQLPSCSEAEHERLSLNEKAAHQGRPISPCIHDGYSRMPLNTTQQACPCSLIHSATRFRSNVPSSNLWLPHFFPHSWFTTLPPISQGTLSLLHGTLSPSHHQVLKPTPSLLFPGLFSLPPTKAGSSTWLKIHLLMPCQKMHIIQGPFFL